MSFFQSTSYTLHFTGQKGEAGRGMMTPRGQVARKCQCWDWSPGQSQLDGELSVQSHRVFHPLEGPRMCYRGGWGRAAGRIEQGTNKWPMEKIIQEAGLKGKTLAGLCVGVPRLSLPLPLPSHPFSSSIQLQVADLLVLIKSPNAGKTSKFQLSASLGFHRKGNEGVMPGIIINGSGAAGEVALPA